MAKVTIYTQVFNAGPYLRPCIDSVLAQTHTDWEHIIADAGSTDGSVEILNEYANSDKRVKFIQLPENRWSQYEMTEKYATGEYYTSLDHDDWWEPEFLERLLKFLMENKLDIAITGVEQYFEETHSAHILRKLDEPVVLSRKEFAEGYEKYGGFANARWASIMHTKQYLSMKEEYDEINKAGLVWRSDTMLMLKYLNHFSKIGIDNTVLQHYRMHSKSQIKQLGFGVFRSVLVYIQTIRAFFEDNGVWNKEKQNWTSGLFFHGAEQALQVLSEARISTSKKIKEVSQCLSDPMIPDVFLSNTMVDVEDSFLVSLKDFIIVVASDKLISEQSIHEFNRAMRNVSPTCAETISPENFPLFALESPLTEKLVRDDWVGMIRYLLDVIGQGKYAEMDLFGMIRQLASNNPALSTIQNTEFFKVYPNVCRWIIGGANMRALDHMTGLLLDDEQIDATEDFLRIYVYLAASLNQDAAFVFGKIRLAKFYLQMGKASQCREILNELKELGAGDHEEVVALENELAECELPESDGLALKALILNSGQGTRMMPLTATHPKCMTELPTGETILSRQLRQLANAGPKDVIITTGPFADIVESYCKDLGLPLNFTFVNNPLYKETNYIYSIYCAREMLQGDILILHGDLVFEDEVLRQALNSTDSGMIVSSDIPLPEKDFKAVLDGSEIVKIGVDFFENAVAAQPLYHLKWQDWNAWLTEIISFCESGNTKCYAENALNEISDCHIKPLDIGNLLCREIDSPEDLEEVSGKLGSPKSRSVYMCFSTDMLHSGHMAIIKRAAELGHLTIGVLSDETVATYKRFPLLPCEERKALFMGIKGVEKVVEQQELSYKQTLLELKPDIVVHGDDWREGFQQPLRQEVLDVLATYGGQLVEFPYAADQKYRDLEQRSRAELSLPDSRRGRLKKLLAMKGLVTAMEAHDGLSGLIVENTVVHADGGAKSFDAMWVSSLCDSTAKGKPDIELVDMTSRFRTIDDLTEVTTKPIIFDGDTGGLTEHFVYTVRSLEKMGVSAVIIEDKQGLKKNSLFGTEVQQTQASIEDFSAKIAAGKRTQKSADFMIIARIESLILERGMEDALARASAFVQAGADGIMIHSRKKEPDEIFEFIRKFREKDKTTPLVVVPTSFNSVTEAEWKERGVNIVIYANQLMRSQVPAMRETAETILRCQRAQEADEKLMPFKDIIRLVPGEV